MSAKFIYHISTQADWQKAEINGFYHTESIDNEGFIHASYAHQVAQSANLFFKGKKDLKLLEIALEKVEPEVKFENTTGGTELFPHIYGNLNLEAVSQVIDFQADVEGVFHFNL